jgi:6-phosphogluconolactonase (cycloisomerase 2 family)
MDACGGDDGKVKAVATYLIPKSGIYTRHLTAYPGGAYLYVVTEAGNELVEYSLGSDAGAPTNEVVTCSRRSSEL